jgi:hypothetical protein
MLCSFMQSHGGRLYTTKATSQQLSRAQHPKWIKPISSQAKRILRDSDANFGNFSSNLFHTGASAGYHSASSSMHSSSCHLMRGHVCVHINSLFSLSLIGKYHNTLQGVDFLLSFVVNIDSGSLSFHLEALQAVQKSSSFFPSNTTDSYLGIHQYFHIPGQI